MKLIKNLKSKIENLPKKPGVYFYYDKDGKLIYIGKASVLKHRVGSYFVGLHDTKTEQLVSQIANIKWKITDSVIEALILESNLIKKYQPKYNIREKDDKSFVQIALTAEDFPRLVMVRPTQKEKINFKVKKYFGPYTNAGAVKEILHIFRRIFTYRDCNERKFSLHAKKNSPCLFYPLNLCPAPCVGNISKKEYEQIIKNMTDFLDGKRKRVVSDLKKEMKMYSQKQEFEKAAIIRNRIEAFTHINDVAVIKHERSLEQTKNIPERIECYDISNLGKDFAVGSMVVFTNGEINTNDYRKFRIKNEESRIKHNSKFIIHNSESKGDPQMMAGVINRRFNHPEWPMPNLIILDGGKGQLSIVLKTLKTKKINIPVMAVAKGPTRKNFTLFKNAQAKNIVLDRKFIERVRDEAHRFAISYHRHLKNKSVKN